MHDVTIRAETPSADSAKPRVSFNKAVHVKRISTTSQANNVNNDTLRRRRNLKPGTEVTGTVPATRRPRRRTLSGATESVFDTLFNTLPLRRGVRRSLSLKSEKDLPVRRAENRSDDEFITRRGIDTNSTETSTFRNKNRDEEVIDEKKNVNSVSKKTELKPKKEEHSGFKWDLVGSLKRSKKNSKSSVSTPDLHFLTAPRKKKEPPPSNDNSQFYTLPLRPKRTKREPKVSESPIDKRFLTEEELASSRSARSRFLEAISEDPANEEMLQCNRPPPRQQSRIVETRTHHNETRNESRTIHNDNRPFSYTRPPLNKERRPFSYLHGDKPVLAPMKPFSEGSLEKKPYGYVRSNYTDGYESREGNDSRRVFIDKNEEEYRSFSATKPLSSSTYLNNSKNSEEETTTLPPGVVYAQVTVANKRNNLQRGKADGMDSRNEIIKTESYRNDSYRNDSNYRPDTYRNENNHHSDSYRSEINGNRNGNGKHETSFRNEVRHQVKDYRNGDEYSSRTLNTKEMNKDDRYSRTTLVRESRSTKTPGFAEAAYSDFRLKDAERSDGYRSEANGHRSQDETDEGYPSSTLRSPHRSQHYHESADYSSNTIRRNHQQQHSDIESSTRQPLTAFGRVKQFFKRDKTKGKKASLPKTETEDDLRRRYTEYRGTEANSIQSMERQRLETPSPRSSPGSGRPPNGMANGTIANSRRSTTRVDGEYHPPASTLRREGGSGGKSLRFFGDSDGEIPSRRTGGGSGTDPGQSSEGDGSQHSKGSVLYLHAATIGDIPINGRRLSRRAQSREELSSTGGSGSGLRPQTKTVSRSFSVLAPWRPKHEIHYGSGKPPRPPAVHKSRDNLSNAPTSGRRYTKAHERNKENLSDRNEMNGRQYQSEVLDKKRQLNSSAESLRLSATRKYGQSTHDLLQSERRRNGSPGKRERLDKNPPPSGPRGNSSSKLSRSMSMPKDTRVGAGWFRLRNK